MRHASLFVAFSFLAFLPAFAAPSCGTYQIVGNQCATTMTLGWATAGLGTDSIVEWAVPLTVSAPVTFQLTQLNSSLGASYTGYFGVYASVGGGPFQVYTLANSSLTTLNPGQGIIIQVTQVCFDPNCSTAPPAGAVANMFSFQYQVLAASATDMAKVYTPLLTVRFLSGGIVTQEEQELAVVGTPAKTNFGVGSVNEAGTPANRYGTPALPFDVFSVTNPSSTQSITGTVALYDYNDNIVATATIPSIPPLGAAGYLLIGRFAGDTLGLFPSSTSLPAADLDSQGVFHGALLATFSGPAIFLSQEFNGNAMLNLVVF
jgi:hypothetical protein